MPSPLFEEYMQRVLDRRTAGESVAGSDERLSVDDLVDLVRHRPVLEALLFHGPLDHRDIEDRLDVSRATSHRFTRWLDGEGYGERVDGGYALSGLGEAVTEELLRFEGNVVAADRLAPLLAVICENHEEFVVEPFAAGRVTVADPTNPFRPMRRFLDLVAASSTLRGFNTAPMVPLGVSEFYDRLFGELEAELVFPRAAVGTLFETYPEAASALVSDGRLALYTREALPYGLVLLDDRVGIGGYDGETGTMRVFVDSGSKAAREWAERTFEAFRSDAEPLDDPSDASANRPTAAERRDDGESDGNRGGGSGEGDRE